MSHSLSRSVNSPPPRQLGGVNYGSASGFSLLESDSRGWWVSRPGSPRYTCSLSPTAPLSKQILSQTTDQRRNILPQLPHTRPCRIHHRVLKFQTSSQPPGDLDIRSPRKAVQPVDDMHRTMAYQSLGLGFTNRRPLNSAQFTRVCPSKSQLRDWMPCRGGPQYIFSQLRKLGWE